MNGHPTAFQLVRYFETAHGMACWWWTEERNANVVHWFPETIQWIELHFLQCTQIPCCIRNVEKKEVQHQNIWWEGLLKAAITGTQPILSIRISKLPSPQRLGLIWCSYLWMNFAAATDAVSAWQYWTVVFFQGTGTQWPIDASHWQTDSHFCQQNSQI